MVGVFRDIDAGDGAVFVDHIEIWYTAVADLDEVGADNIIGFGDGLVVVVEIGDGEVAVLVDVDPHGVSNIVRSGVVIIVAENRGDVIFGEVVGESGIRVGLGFFGIFWLVWGFWVFGVLRVFEIGDGFVFFGNHGL